MICNEKRKNHSTAFKAKVALDAIREELTLSELAKKHGVHANQISRWKRAAIENMATAFTRGKVINEHVSSAELEKLHSKIGQLVVERDFLADASVHRLGKSLSAVFLENMPAGQWAKNGEQGTQPPECSPPMRLVEPDPLQSVLHAEG